MKNQALWANSAIHNLKGRLVMPAWPIPPLATRCSFQACEPWLTTTCEMYSCKMEDTLLPFVESGEIESIYTVVGQWREVVEVAEKIDSEYWVISGNNLPDDNAVIAALALKIKILEQKLEKLNSE